MRILIISDSHGRRMDGCMRTLNAAWDVRVMAVGRGTAIVREMYQSRRSAYQDYSPDGILIHLCHNDIVHHPRHNPHPISSSLAFTQAMEFMDEVGEDMPYARMVYSSIFPRCIGSSMSRDERIRYNNEAYVFGEMVRSSCTARGRRFVLNQDLWESPVDGLARSTLFMPDGLHLNWQGKKVVANEWMEALCSCRNRL